MLQRIRSFLRGSPPKVQDPWDQAAVADWWETVHQNEELLWLSGSTPEHVWKFLGVDTKMSPGQAVLNVGVGLGHDTRALQKRGLIVSALDISPTALDRVRDVTERAWLASEIEQIPADTFDWILSYLVSQHMSDDDLRHQLTHLVPALKAEGVFALQFADHPTKSLDLRNTTAYQKGGGACRGPDEVASLVAECGGRVVWASAPWPIPDGSGTVFHAVHIIRNSPRN